MLYDSHAERHVRLAAATLEDKYALLAGRAYLTGIQALIRLCINQRLRDASEGRNTAGFISGYRGSPLGPLDKELWKATEHLKRTDLRFTPGINEELAATAVMGSQQTDIFPGSRYDGVFAMWYGKGPGVDRCADVFKHGNFAGSSRHGGVLLVAGDDHGAYSSSLPNQSEQLFASCSIPVLNPAGVQDILDLGVHGFALSRYSGCWIGFKALADTVESAAVADLDPARVSVRLPDDFPLPLGGLNVRSPDTRFAQEARLFDYRLDAVRAYIRANALNHVAFDAPEARIGIVATGKSWLDLRKALDDLGFGLKQAAEVGLRLCKVSMPWPLEPESMRTFARGLDEIIVIEEKRPLIEPQLKDILYGLPPEARPRIVGKDIAPAEANFERRLLLSDKLDFSSAEIALLIAARLRERFAPERLRARVAQIEERLAASKREAIDLDRQPWFCSGCPHNTSTKVPEGSLALAGIGCHWMANWIRPESTRTTTQMGGEGVTWVGLEPFTDTPHIFVNLGDGTYYHSGILAIRQAIAAKSTITYKLLYNDAVAMTGGQPVEGPLSVPIIVAQLRAEGVARIVVVTDDPTRYEHVPLGDADIPIYHRDRLDHVQRELRETKGVSVLIYDQTCAVEKQRRRKRSEYPDPALRLVINEEVCEGCGDCGAVSNCTALAPVETELGRKRSIDQSRCSKDTSCLKGFCPSFVTVEGGRLKKGASRDLETEAQRQFGELPEATLPALDRPYRVLLTGIGGSGILTASAVLGIAGQLDGIGVLGLDMTGMSQKNGGVISHVHFAGFQDALTAARIGVGDADAVLALDSLVAVRPEWLARVTRGHTRFVGNTAKVMPGQFTGEPDLAFPLEHLQRVVDAEVGSGRSDWLDVNQLAQRLLGDSMPANLLLLGYAWQKGLLPVTRQAIERAIELNGVGVDANRAAFLWGRRAAVDIDAVHRLVMPALPIKFMPRRTDTLERLVTDRSTRLTVYQDAAYATRYAAMIGRVQAAEQAAGLTKHALAKAVARSYFKLLAYKDEYEVARLHAESGFLKRISDQFEGDYRIAFHLAPPILAPRDPDTGLPVKRRFGPWMLPAFRVLAKLKGLRGTPFDPFGYTAERRMERKLIRDYEALIDELITGLTGANYETAMALASLPDTIRGFGHVKLAAVEAAQREQAALLTRFRTTPPLADAA
jgi:indolepyruvate ferredoxin oxidoreductase